MSRSRTESVCTNESQKRVKNTDTGKSRSLAGSNAGEARSRVASADTGEAQNRDKNADRNKSHQRTESASTGEAQNQNKKADSSKLRSRAPSTITGDAPATSDLSIRNKSDAEKKRRRSTVHERNDSADGLTMKRSKTSRHSLRSSVSSVDVSNLVNESPPATASQNQRSKTNASTAKSPVPPITTPKKSRNRRPNDAVPSTSGQGTILKYLSKLSCKKCRAVLKTLPESKFHEKCHAMKQCPLCKKSIRSAEASNHVQTCLLMSRELTTEELKLYMKPLSINLIRCQSAILATPIITNVTSMAPNIKKEKGSVPPAQNGNPGANIENSDSEVIRPPKRISCSKPIIIDSSSEEETRGKFKNPFLFI